MAFLTPDNTRTEYGLTVKEKIIPFGALWPKNVYGKDGSLLYKKGSLYKADRKLSGGTGIVQYVTIHNTGAITPATGTTMAEQYTRATWPNANMNDARVHYYVDHSDCWQLLREDEVGWHAADGRGPGNETSLAIEIIMDGSGSAQDKLAEDRGALLAAILLHRHDLSLDRLTTHNRWHPQKYCPLYILPHWEEFRQRVLTKLTEIQKSSSSSDIADSTVNSQNAEPTEIHKGYLVSIAPDAEYYTGVAIPAWVKAQNWYVLEEPIGDRVVIHKSQDGKHAICSPIHRKYLTVIYT